MKRKRQLCHSRIYVKENLTKCNNTLFYFAHNAHKRRQITHTWTDSGRMWYTLNEGESPVLLKHSLLHEAAL